MEVVRDRPACVVPPARDRELQLIREAIAMVAAGRALRVVVAGIAFGDSLVKPGQRLALEAGVRLRPLSRTDDAGIDLAVEQIVE